MGEDENESAEAEEKGKLYITIGERTL